MAGNDEMLEFILRMRDEASKQLEGFTKGVDATGKTTKKTTGEMGAMAVAAAQTRSALTSLAAGWFGVTAILGSFSVAAYKSVQAFAQLETEQARYNAVLKATQFAAGKTQEDIEELASSLRQSTGALEGDVRQAAAALATFPTISGEQFDQTLRLSRDVAAVLGGDMASAARTLGRALENPIEGMTMLRRIGIQLTETQKEQIKNFSESGQSGKATQVVLDELARRVGGAGAAQGDTLTGALAKASEAANNLQETFGEVISKGLNLPGIIKGISAAVDSFNRGAQKALAANKPRAFRQQEIDAQMDTAEFGRMTAENERYANSVEGVTIKLKDELEELKKGAFQQQLSIALKQAQTQAGRELTEADKARIEGMVRENFIAKNGVALYQQRVAALGELATVSQRVQAENLKIVEAQKAGAAFTREELALMRQRNEVKAAESVLQQRVSLGIASAQDIARQKQIEFDLVTRQYNLTAQETANVNTVLTRKYEEMAEGIAVATARYPELTRAALDATNVNKQVDQFMTSSIGTLSSGITDVISGTKTAREAFADMARSIINNLSQMIIKALLFRAVSAAFGGGAGSNPVAFPIPGVTNFNANGNVYPFAKGGAFTNMVVDVPTLFKFAKGGKMAAGVMGEAGPEAIMPLKRTSTGELGVRVADGGKAGNSQISYSPTIIVNSDGTSSKSRGPSDTADGQRLGEVLDNRLRSVVIEVLQDQQRSGGMLSGA